MVIGRKMASAPMFFIRADMKATEPDKNAIWRVGVFNLPATGRTSASITPDRAIPALTIRAEAMMMTMSSAKPEKASFAGINPRNTPASRASTATTSKRSLFQTSITTTMPTNAKAMNCCRVIERPSIDVARR